jgi:hypothetical protein
VAVAVRQRQFIFHYRRGAVAAASKKRKFKKLLNLYKISILKNATLNLDQFHRLEAIALV